MAGKVDATTLKAMVSRGDYLKAETMFGGRDALKEALQQYGLFSKEVATQFKKLH